MNQLDRAIQLAVKAHAGQLDKAQKPYILHALRVMFKQQTEKKMVVAVLHDVLEDSEWTANQLRKEGFEEDVIEAIECLTRTDSMSYQDYIENIKSNNLARSVKLADLEDNMDTTRMSNLSQIDIQRLIKYHKARNSLRSIHPEN